MSEFEKLRELKVSFRSPLAFAKGLRLLRNVLRTSAPSWERKTRISSATVIKARENGKGSIEKG